MIKGELQRGTWRNKRTGTVYVRVRIRNGIADVKTPGGSSYFTGVENIERVSQDQEKLTKFISDPETIKRAAEGSMKKRQKILDGQELETQLAELAGLKTIKQVDSIILPTDKLIFFIEALRIEARIEALKWALGDYNMPDTDTKKNIQWYIDQEMIRLSNLRNEVLGEKK